MVIKIMNKLLTTLVILFSFCHQVSAANGVGLKTENIFVGIGKKDGENRSTTLLYGISGFSELTTEWRINYGISGNIVNGFIFSAPISLAYVPLAEYKFHLRPQIFAGIEPFYANLSDFQGIKLYGQLGIAIDYVFDNNWYITAGSKIYINDSFFKEKIDNDSFNTGVASIFVSSGIKY